MFSIYSWLPKQDPKYTGVAYETFAGATAMVISFAAQAMQSAQRKTAISSEVIDGDLIVRVYETKSSQITHRWIVRED